MAVTVHRVAGALGGITESFQATFYRLASDRVAKVYGRHRVWERIKLDDPQARQEIIERELRCLQKLSPSLEPEIALVELPTGEREVAIIMNRLDPSEFLEPRLQRDESLSCQLLERLAYMVAEYHFDSAICPVADLSSQSLPSFLRTLLRQEQATLSRVLESKHESTAFLVPLYSAAERYIVANERQISTLQEIMREPIVGHGDLKSQNIVFTRDSRVCVVDAAPLPEWRINTRRMDALFLVSELSLLGRSSDADAFWRAYCREYSRRSRDLIGSSYPSREIVESVDNISRFYRANIFFRLAHAGINPQLAESALALMRESIAA